MSRLQHAKSIRLPRIRTRRTLVVVALGAQFLVLLTAWTLTFRHVRGRISERVGHYLLEENVEVAERLQSLLPTDENAMPAFGTPEWEEYQRVIESAGAELAAGGFACLLDAEGKILCHPDIREDMTLRRVDLGTALLESIDESVGTRRIDQTTDMATGRIRFLADGTHYVATSEIEGTDLRLLVHQPERELFGASSELTGVVVSSGVVAITAIMLFGGGALVTIIRSYDSTIEEINRRLQGNLQIARHIQRSTLPLTTPTLAGYDIAGWSESADETGGDTFDLIGTRRLEAGIEFVHENADAVVCVLADATGHGIPAALAISEYRALVRGGLRAGVDLGTLVRQVNAQMHADLPSGRFVTSWICVVEAKTGVIQAHAAGQGPVYVCRTASGEVEHIPADCMPLGIVPDVGEVTTCRIQLEPGDAIVVPSDGVHETMDASGQLYGMQRLEALLGKVMGESAEGIIERVRTSAEAFAGSTAAGDDRTIVVIKRV